MGAKHDRECFIAPMGRSYRNTDKPRQNPGRL